MFKHHKFCVVDVLGLLVAHESPQHTLDVYLLDSSAEMKARLRNSTPAEARALEMQLQAANQRIKIADSALLAFIRQQVAQLQLQQQFQHPAYHLLTDAHITGTLDLDTDGVQFHQVSRAVLQSAKGAITWQPAG